MELRETKLDKRDKEWFPRWLRRYAQTVVLVEGILSATEAEVIEFSRSLRDAGTPAWQRLQAVRAIETYRNLVLSTDQPSLQAFRLKLGRIVEQENMLGRSSAQDERQLFSLVSGLCLGTRCPQGSAFLKHVPPTPRLDTRS